jgi:hypothetical protein
MALGLPLLILWMVTTDTTAPDDVVDDFARLAKSVNSEVRLVESNGSIRQGILTAVMSDTVTLALDTGARTFARNDIVAADRLRDSVKDGFIKGVVLGAIVGLLPGGLTNTNPRWTAWWIGSMAVAGAAFDGVRGQQVPIYRAGATFSPTVAVRF